MTYANRNFPVKEVFERNIYHGLDGCWYWIGHHNPKTGYGVFHSFRVSSRAAHRVAYELFKEPPPRELLVCHSCDNRLCVNPDHLFLGTHQDNVSDCVNKGRFIIPSGVKNHMAKLTAPQVAEVRMNKEKLTNAELGLKYGLDPAAISRIKNRKTYK